MPSSLKRTNLIFIALSLLIVGQLYGREHAFRTGVMPTVGISFNPIDKLKLGFEYSSQEVFINKSHSEDFAFDFVHYRTDLRLNISYELKENLSAMIGYQFRYLHDKTIAHRPIFQLKYSHETAGKISLKHQLRSDPTFYKSKADKFRLRYRFGVEFPLSCKSNVAPKSYIFIADEPVYTFQEKKNYIENRISLTYGYNINNQQSIKFGLEHRLAEIEKANNQLSHQFWLRLDWEISF